MLFFRIHTDDPEIKEELRVMIKEHTGEDCMFIPEGLDFIGNVPVRKDGAVPECKTAQGD